MASKSVLDLFSKVIKAPHNGQPKLCMQLVKHLQLLSNEPVSIIRYNNSFNAFGIYLHFAQCFLVGRTSTKRSFLCVNKIGSWIRVSKNTSPNRLFFSFGGNCKPLGGQVMVQSGQIQRNCRQGVN